MNHYDFLVIGAGPAGGTAALLLARHGYKVALAERKAFPRKKVCGEYLSATNLPLLESLGIASVFRTASGPEVVSVGLFAGESVIACPIPRPGGYAAEGGRALSREALDPLLMARGVEAGVTVYQPVSVEGMQRNPLSIRSMPSTDTGWYTVTPASTPRLISSGSRASRDRARPPSAA